MSDSTYDNCKPKYILCALTQWFHISGFWLAGMKRILWFLIQVGNPGDNVSSMMTLLMTRVSNWWMTINLNTESIAHDNKRVLSRSNFAFLQAWRKSEAYHVLTRRRSTKGNFYGKETTKTASAPQVTLCALCGVQRCERDFLLLAMSSGIIP